MDNVLKHENSLSRVNYEDVQDDDTNMRSRSSGSSEYS